MGNPAIPLESFTTFGSLLKYLRSRAQLTQLELSIAVGYSESQISRLENSRRLPEPARLAALLVPALGLENEPEIVSRLLELASLARDQQTDFEPQVRLLGSAPLSWWVVPRSNLPAELTSFIGRNKEISAVCQRVLNHRLVTLTGTGGTGKTRLALRASEDLQNKFQYGAWWVDLAPLTDPDHITEAIASVFQLKAYGDTPLAEVLDNYLRPKDLLLVLDNCEHLLDALAGLAHHLLQTAPNLKLLATSRAPLGIGGEATYRVPSMTFPQAQLPQSAGDLMEFEAVQLFVARAQAVQSDFRFTSDNQATVSRICQLLDGIPLAIELAAARVRMLSVEQIASRLDQAFLLLAGGDRAVLRRHQTLRASIDWSYNLLTHQERTLLNRLSVFAGGWTLEAAEQVCADIEGNGPDRIQMHQVVDLLGSLIDQSLVQFEPVPGAAPRYRLLETVRQYAGEKLVERGEEDPLRERHLDYFLWLGRQAEPHLRAFEAKYWLERLERELDNLRQALGWALAGSLVKGLQLTAALRWFWWIYRHLTEEGDWLEALLTKARELDFPSLVKAEKATIARATDLLIHITNHNLSLSPNRKRQLSQVVYLDSKAIFRELGESYHLDYAMACFLRAETIEDFLACREQFLAIQDRFWIATCDSELAEYLPPDDERATFYAEENLRIRIEIGDLDGQGQAFVKLGWIEWGQGHIERCAELTQKGMDCFQTIGNRWFLAHYHARLAGLEALVGNIPKANRHINSLESIARELNDPWLLYKVPIYRAQIACDTGQYAQAIKYCQEALRLGQVFSVESKFELFFNLFRINLQQGDQAQALNYLQFYFTEKNFWVDWQFSFYTVRNLALWAARNDCMEQAAIWSGVFDQLLAQNPWFIHHFSPVDRAEMEQTRSAVRAALGEEAYQAAWESGRAMTVEQVIQMAQEMLS